MNMKIALTTIAGLAVAGAATACEHGAKTMATELTSATAPTVLQVGNDGKRKSKARASASELKVIITDGEARFWIDGEEVDSGSFAKAGGNVVVSPESGSWMVKRDGTARIAELPRVVAAPTKPMQLGVVLGDVSDALARQLDVDAKGLILIERVMEGTPAAKGGLEAFDVLVEFGGEDNLSIEKLRKLISKQSPGDDVEVLVLRNGEDETLRVTFDIGEFSVQGRAAFPFGDVAARTPPRVHAAPRAPKAERFFGRAMDDETRAHFEKAMAHAEEQAHHAQEQATRWQVELKEMLHGEDGIQFAFNLNHNNQENLQEAMTLLRGHLEELNVDFDFDNLDMDNFPRIQFIEDYGNPMPERADKLKKRAVVLGKRLVERGPHARDLELQAIKLKRLAKHNAERAEGRSEQQIDRLEQRIEDLEAVIEKLVKKLESRKPRGVRN